MASGGWQYQYFPFLFAGNTFINQNGLFVYSGNPSAPVTLQGQIKFVQNVAANLTGATGTTLKLTVPAGVTTTVGDTLIIHTQMAAVSVTASATDTKGNTWVQDANVTNVGAGQSASILSTRLTTALVAGDQITITASASTNNMRGACFEFSGIISGTRLDQTATNSATSGLTIAASTPATTQAVELAFTGFNHGGATRGTNSITNPDSSSGGDWVNARFQPDNFVAEAYQLLTKTTAVTASWTTTGTTPVYVMIATYKATVTTINSTLIASVAGTAGTDQFGNPYQAGFQSGGFIAQLGQAFFYTGLPAAGNLLASLAGTSGTDPFGNPFAQGFQTGNVLIQTGAAFFYSTVPSTQNLLASIAGVAGTDPFGNPYQAGVQVVDGIFNSAGAFFYSATPAASVLLAAIAGASGTDPFGNAFGAGLTLVNVTPGSAITGAALLQAVSGGLNVVDGLDTQVYDTQRLTLAMTADVSVASTSAVTLTGLTCKLVGGRSYHFEGIIFSVPGGTAAGQQTILFTFTGTSGTGASRIAFWSSIEGASTQTVDLQNIVNFSGTFTIPAYALASNVHVLLRGTMAITATGTLTIQMKNVTSGDTTTAKAGSFLCVMPIIQ